MLGAAIQGARATLSIDNDLAGMLKLPIKVTDKIELQRALHRFVEVAYSEESAEEHRDAFIDVANLRESCRQMNPAPDDKKAAEGNVRLLARYHRLLTTLRVRFSSCLLYTSPSPRDRTRSRMPSSA